jgi:hypothetical protein
MSTRLPGRPSKLDPERAKRFFTVIRTGATIEAASALAGVAVRSIYNWLEKGRAGRKGDYVQFLRAFELARAEGEITMISAIRTAGRQDWRATAWILERSYQPKWSLRQQLEHSGPDGAPISGANPFTIVFRLHDPARPAEPATDNGGNAKRWDYSPS